ncbi:MAG: DUF3990 domain-containing protein, partial [Desulfovibrio sp.]|nr:DUF3990 domain-containing protein [Desulfovibrio sp.]
MHTITLYHCSSYDFDAVDLQQSRPYKDFGQGFYTSVDISHAKSMADRNAQIDALRIIMETKTYELLQDPESRLCFESAESILDMLSAEAQG